MEAKTIERIVARARKAQVLCQHMVQMLTIRK